MLQTALDRSTCGNSLICIFLQYFLCSIYAGQIQENSGNWGTFRKTLAKYKLQTNLAQNSPILEWCPRHLCSTAIQYCSANWFLYGASLLGHKLHHPVTLCAHPVAINKQITHSRLVSIMAPPTEKRHQIRIFKCNKTSVYVWLTSFLMRFIMKNVSKVLA